jgi:glycosyltransferase involved in cell wall biosynthesis
MLKSAIYVNRFKSSNGVGNAAISLFEDLVAREMKVEVYCMRRDERFVNNSNIHRFPIEVPYSLEVFILALWAFFVSHKFHMNHSFEVTLKKCNFYHLHFDTSLSKSTTPVRSIRGLGRFIAAQGLQFGLRLAISANSELVVPSDLLREKLVQQSRFRQSRVVVYPNRLSAGDVELVNQASQIKKSIESASELEKESETYLVALIANGDFNYKGLSRLDEILAHLPECCSLVLVGGKNSPKVDPRFADRVIWHHEKDRTELFGFYSNVAGLIVASPFESFSMVALEAVSLGVPTLFLGNAGIIDLYEEYLSTFDRERLMFRVNAVEQWRKQIMIGHNLQLDFNDFLTSLRDLKVKDFLRIQS